MPIELILDRVEAGVSPRMMLPIAFEELVASLQGLFREETQRKGRETKRLPCVEEELMEGNRHVEPAVELNPQLGCGKSVGVEGFDVDGVVGVDEDEQLVNSMDELLVDPSEALKLD